MPGEAAAGGGGAASGAAGTLNAVGVGLSALQAGLGIVQSISGKSKMKKLLAQRKAYETPEEYFDILEATQSMAQQGYDAFTLSYLTDQMKRGLGSSIGESARLGANPNDMAEIYSRFEQGIMKIGAENHALNMENFSRYLTAKDVIGQNKAAEWSSQQDIIKDKMQAAGAEMQSGVQNIGSGANMLMGALSGKATSGLFTDDYFTKLASAMKKMERNGGAAATSGGPGSVGYAPDFDNYQQPGG